MRNVPYPVVEHFANMPQQNMGTLYAVVKHPWLPIKREYKLEAWGQLCNGRDHRKLVHLMLYNRFQNHGKGYTYVSWRAEPNHPEINTHLHTGVVANPKPYSGVAYD